MAAGRGVRAGGAKQFWMLGGKTLLERAVEAFVPMVQGVAVAAPEGEGEQVAGLLAGVGVPVVVVTGGGHRNASLEAAVAKLGEGFDLQPGDVLLTHDAARPLVSRDIIARHVAHFSQNSNAVTNTAVPVADTIVRGGEGQLTGTLERSELFAVQTPQGFCYGDFVKVFGGASKTQKGQATDPCSLFFDAGYAVDLLAGEPNNFKITQAADLRMAEGLIQESE